MMMSGSVFRGQYSQGGEGDLLPSTGPEERHTTRQKRWPMHPGTFDALFCGKRGSVRMSQQVAGNSNRAPTKLRTY